MESYGREYPLQLIRDWDKAMVGQREYKEALARNLYRYVVKGEVPSPMLVMGPTGSGKTFLPTLFKKSKLCPPQFTVFIKNISCLTMEGVKGEDLEEIFKEYKTLCQAQGNRGYRGLIYLDEVDKLITSQESTVEFVADQGRMVQHQLMQILDGGEMAGVPLNKIMFVFGGAFYQLRDRKKETENLRPIGFGAESIRKPVLLKDNTIREKLTEIGFQREFLGRIGQIVQLQALNEAELKALFLHPTKGVLSRLQKEYEADGIRLEVEDAVVDDIIRSVVQENLGARSLPNIMEQLLSGAWIRCIEEGYDQIVINKGTLRGEGVKFSNENRYISMSS